MGKYLNPGNAGFRSIRKSRYIDKTELIAYINRTLGTKQKQTLSLLCSAEKDVKLIHIPSRMI